MDFIDVCVYDNYLAGIPNTKSYYNTIKKQITSSKTSSVTSDDVMNYLSLSETVDNQYTNRVISDNWTLTDDYHTYGDLIINGGTVNLNEFTLTVDGNMIQNDDVLIDGGTLNVKGDLIQNGGCMFINDGTLNVNGDYSINTTGTLRMLFAADRVNVHGDFIMQSNAACYWGNDSSYCFNKNCFKDGILAIDGNFYQYNGDEANFQSYGDFKLKFIGITTHEIYFGSSNSYLGNLETDKNAKIKFTGIFHGFEMIQDLVIEGDVKHDCATMSLNENTLTIQGDLIQNDDVLIDGGTLNVKGDLIQNGGCMFINGGTLNVNGDYSINTVTNYIEKTDETIIDSTGTLRMLFATDRVNVHGDFIMQSNAACYWGNDSSYCFNNNCFKDGIFAVDGDFYQYNGDEANFQPYGDFKLVFTCAKIHYFTSESSSTKTGTIVLVDGAKLAFKGSLNGLNNVDKLTYTSEGNATKTSGNTITATKAGTDTITITDGNGNKATINIIVNEYIIGDVNCDGEITVADVVLLQKWLLAVPNTRLPAWKYADMDSDSRLDVFDLVLLRRKLING